MAKREIVVIDEGKCNGCGLCVPNCQEGALQIIDHKARLISELFCDGLGACVGHCPQGAITIEKRDVHDYDERKVMELNIVPKGANTIRAHLEHLRDHGAKDYFHEAVDYLEENGIPNPLEENNMEHHGHGHAHGGCPGARMMDFSEKAEAAPARQDDIGTRQSMLRQWPVQLHLVNPQAPYFQGADLLLAADCTAFALGDFHKDFLKGKSLAIACPKLDDGQEEYVEKLTSLIDDAKVNTITIAIMEVPCCGGLVSMAEAAREAAKRKVPLKQVVVGIRGGIQSEEWI